MANKQTPKLSEAASSAGSDDSLDVVLELKEVNRPSAPSTLSRAEQIQLTKKSFSQQVQPLKEKIASLGGEVVNEAWLNSTISARVPKRGLEALEHDDQVASIDLPRAIERE
jgi:hypothetical protein